MWSKIKKQQNVVFNTTLLFRGFEKGLNVDDDDDNDGMRSISKFVEKDETYNV